MSMPLAIIAASNAFSYVMTSLSSAHPSGGIPACAVQRNNAHQAIRN